MIMRIGICNGGFNRYGGIEFLVSNIGRAINTNGHELVVLHGGRDYEGAPNKACYTYLPENYFLNRLCCRARNLFLKSAMMRHGQEADHWLVGHLYLLAPVLQARKKNGCEYTVSLLAHGKEMWNEWTPEQHEALMIVDRIVAVSNYTADIIRLRLPREMQGKVSVIPPCYKVEGNPEYVPPRSESPSILTVSRLAPEVGYKGHHLVIRALPKVQERLRKKVDYHIVGTGKLVGELKELAAELGVAENTHFYGRVDEDELDRLYGQSWVFVMPSATGRESNGESYGEGFGIVYIEAAMFGVPSIAANIGGQTDCIVDGVTGYLIPPVVSALEEAMFKVLSDPLAAQNMGASALSYVRKNFSYELFSKKWNRHWVEMQSL